MSSSVPMQLDVGIKTAFNDGMVRAIQVGISEDERLTLLSKAEKSSSEQGDYDRMKTMVSASEPCYLLFRFNSGNGWAIVTFVPDTCPVKSKMLFAATKATLKGELGNEHFKEDLQADAPADLSWESRAAPAGADKPYSQREKHIMELDRMETSARSEFSQSLSARTPSPALTPPGSQGSQSSRPASTGPGGSGSGRSSGYHAVSLPLAAGVDAKLRDVRGGANVVELRISAAADAVEHVSSFSAGSAAELGERLSAGEPRFYLFNKGAAGVFLVYCCPPASDRKLRMVYSTAKGAVLSHCEKALGPGAVKKAVEVSEKDDVTEEAFGGKAVSVASAARPAGGPTDNRARTGTAGSKSNSMNGPAHPVYGLMNQGGTTSSTTKKIVIPPSYAWQ